MSVRARAAICSAASAWSSCACMATVRSSALSPSTATARATAPAALGRRERRSSTVRETARGPIWRTTSTWPASGSTPSASSELMSWLSSSGLPPVASTQAALKRSSASDPSRASTSSPTLRLPSGPGCTATTFGPPTISASSAGSVPGSPLRSPVATSRGRPSSRGAR